MRRLRWLACLALLVFAADRVQACDSCAASVQLPINTGLQVAQIAATTAAIVAAIGTNGGGNGAATMGNTSAIFEAAKSVAAANFASERISLFREAKMRAVTNPQSLNCRVATRNATVSATEDTQRAVTKSLENSIIDGYYFNPSLTPQRAAASFLYRLCKNGQLAPGDFGPNWFNANGCINDPTTVHDFLKISTILDSPLLVPPPAAGNVMDTLYNPASYTAAQVQTARNGLTQKMKKYIGAQLYCENLIVGKAVPQNIRNSAASDPRGMFTAFNNMGAMSALSVAYDACTRELARRTAINTALLPAGPYRANLEDATAKMVEFLTTMRGADRRKYLDYATDADYQADNPLAQRYMSKYIEERHMRDHGLSIKCVGYANSGTDAGRTNTMLNCAMTAALWERNEAARTKAFIEGVAAASTAPGFGDDSVNKIQTNYQPGAPGHQPRLQEAALDIPGFDKQPMRLEEMLQTMTAAEHPDIAAGIPMPAAGAQP